jgi:thioredoxin reductase
MSTNHFDVIIIGGSYAGLSAAMALGRSLRRVLIIDSGKPCNQQTPHSHNFIPLDGEKPAVIAGKAKAQVLNYETVQFHNGLAIEGIKTANGFTVKTEAGDSFTGRKLLFATGLTDQMPAITGFDECWGISVLHCPYCHGYEVRHQNIGIISNGDAAFEFVRLISNWTKKLTLFTNGKSTLSEEQTQKIKSHSIQIIEKEIAALEHSNGSIEHIIFNDNTRAPITAIFAKPALKQHCDIPRQLGCEINEQGLIKVDDFQKTTIAGVYAAGDNSSMRAVSIAVASGTKAGAVINKELIEEEF